MGLEPGTLTVTTSNSTSDIRKDCMKKLWKFNPCDHILLNWNKLLLLKNPGDKFLKKSGRKYCPAELWLFSLKLVSASHMLKLEWEMTLYTGNDFGRAELVYIIWLRKTFPKFNFFFSFLYFFTLNSYEQTCFEYKLGLLLDYIPMEWFKCWPEV